jgi:hypothetical protein
MQVRITFTLLLLCCICTSIVSAYNYTLSAETGETYIQWKWRAINSSVPVPLVDIYLDDSQVPVITNYSSTTYIADQIRSGERHNIILYNSTARLSGSSELLVRGTITTLKPAYEIYVLWGICALLMVLVFFMGEVIRLVLLSIFDIILCLFGASLAVNRGAIPYLFIGVAIITGIILLINGIPRLREEINWW